MPPDCLQIFTRSTAARHQLSAYPQAVYRSCSTSAIAFITVATELMTMNMLNMTSSSDNSIQFYRRTVVTAVPTATEDAVRAMICKCHHHLQGHCDLGLCALLQAYRYSAVKANDALDGGLTPQLHTRMPAGAQNGAVASQQQQAGAVNGLNEQHQSQQRTGGGPLQPFNGQQSTAPWKAPWQQDINKPVQHRCKPPLPRPLPHLPDLSEIRKQAGRFA